MNECHASSLFTQVENEAGKWLLVEREAMQPIGWIDAQACIAEDNQENPQEKESISQDVSLSCVKKPTDVENSTGEH